MNDVIFPLPSRLDLLTALISQGRSVKRFGLLERDAGETLSLLSKPLAPALFQADGLLNEKKLEPFFADPLPDTSLAAALTGPAGPEPGPLPDTSPASLKKKKTSRKEDLNKGVAAAEIKTLGQKAQKKKQPVMAQKEDDHSVASGRQSANSQKHDSAITQTIEKRVTALRESKKNADSKDKIKPSGAIERFDVKNGGKSRITGKVGALPARQAQPETERKNSPESKKSKTIDRRRAAQILEEKWQHRAWKSPLDIKGKSARAGLLRDENRKPSGLDERSLRNTERKLEKKLARLLDKKFFADKRSDTLDTVVDGKSGAQKETIPDTKKTQRHEPMPDPASEQAEAQAFAPAPSTSAKAETLVGLRGLAARAAANESAAVTEQAPTSAQARTPGPEVSRTSALEPTGNSARSLSVSELADLITREAKRAGIDLEQFQP